MRDFTVPAYCKANHLGTPDTTTPILIGDRCGLLEYHRRQLHARGLSDETIAAARLYSETNARRLSFLLKWRGERGAKGLGACIAIPFFDVDGRESYTRLRPDVPRKDQNGKPIKYESPKGEPNAVYIPVGVRDRLDDPGAELLITEGEFKALAATQHGFRTLGLVGVHGWKAKGEAACLPSLERIAWEGRNVFIAFDSDIAEKPGVQAAQKWLAHLLKLRGANVKVVLLPHGPKGEKLGLDDYLVIRGPAELRKLLDNAQDPEEPSGDTIKQNAESADPASEAQKVLNQSSVGGIPRLRFWRGSFWFWTNGCYREILGSEVEAIIARHLNGYYFKVGKSVVGNVQMQTKALSMLPSWNNPPCWVDNGGGEWSKYPGTELLVCKNGIVHLPSFVNGLENYLRPATPQLFCTSALDFDFDPHAPTCDAWLSFLSQLWKNDRESIDTLQEWCGYCLTPDTRLQKILLLIGPKRSGKGTINRIMRSIVGEANCCSPTLASLATQFGLWPLLGKMVATISDARLSGRTDQSIVTERLLSISGEDDQTVDRKNLEPITTKLLSRFVIISNELPRLQDSSGALTGRFVTLRLTESFYGKEDPALTEKLLSERAGILQWAIHGWKRLRDRGYFVQPESSDCLRQQMDDLASPIAAFIRDCCIVDDSCEVRVDSLYGAWREWCQSAGREPGTKQTFGRDILAAVPRVRSTQPREGEIRYRAYVGIGLNA